jgi:hypothetical protein
MWKAAICSFQLWSTTEPHLLYLSCFDVVEYASPHPVKTVVWLWVTLSASRIKRMIKNTIVGCFVPLCSLQSACLQLCTYAWYTTYITFYQFCISFYSEGAGIETRLRSGRLDNRSSIFGRKRKFLSSTQRSSFMPISTPNRRKQELYFQGNVAGAWSQPFTSI